MKSYSLVGHSYPSVHPNSSIAAVAAAFSNSVSEKPRTSIAPKLIVAVRIRWMPRASKSSTKTSDQLKREASSEIRYSASSGYMCRGPEPARLGNRNIAKFESAEMVEAIAIASAANRALRKVSPRNAPYANTQATAGRKRLIARPYERRYHDPKSATNGDLWYQRNANCI